MTHRRQWVVPEAFEAVGCSPQLGSALCGGLTLRQTIHMHTEVLELQYDVMMNRGELIVCLSVYPCVHQVSRHHEAL